MARNTRSRGAKKEIIQEKRVIKDKFLEQRKSSFPSLQARTENQRKAFKALSDKELVVLSGTAGTGKSLIAAWHAARQYYLGEVDTIIITRPLTGLGDTPALPGSDFEKALPFALPFLQKLKQFLGVGVLRNDLRTEGDYGLFEEVSGIVVFPIEKFGGLSFGPNTIVIGEEIQAATPSQVKALVTRCEEGAQLIITGDNVQTPLGDNNGLKKLQDTLLEYPHKDAEVVLFEPKDCQRSGVSAHLASIFESEGTW